MLGNLAKFIYQRRNSLLDDPFDKFMRDGAEKWSRLTSDGKIFTLNDPELDLPLGERLRKRQEYRNRLEKRKEDQMKRADARRSYYRKLRAARRLVKEAKEAAAKRKMEENRDRIRKRILRRIQREKPSRTKSTR
jgi:hypothetical protein